MLGQFLDRLNLRLRNSEDKIKEKEKETRTNNKALPPKSTQPHPSRIASLSPETTSHSTQYHFRQYSPTATSRTNTGKPLLEETKSFNPSGIIPKRYGEDKTPSHYHPTPTNMSRVLQPNKPEIHRDKPKNVPNFEFRPLDKESFATSSANTSMREGSIIVQSIRPSQMVTASNKLIFGGIRQVEPKSPEHKGMTPGNKISKPAKDSSLDKTPKINYQEINPAHFETANQRRQHAWQEWWNEKKQNNLQLIEAARLGNLKLASQLLDKRKGDLVANVNGKADNDWTPLHFACLNGDSEFVSLLLLNEANIDAETTLKFTPLHVAAQKGHAEIVQLLANSGADINCKDLYNNTPIHYAAQNDHKRIVQLLLSRPSLDLDIKNNDNKLAYDLAANSEIKRIFEAFIAEKNILNSNFTKKVTIHNTKAESIQKMFESAMSNKHPMQLQQTRSTENVPNKKPPAYGTTFTVSGDTKHSSVNSSDSDIANNENNAEEEKIGPHSFIVHSMIGKGSFGEVYLVEKKNTNTYYAMKVLHKTRIAKHNLVRYVMTERNVLSVTNHPFIVKLIYAFQTPDKLFLIMDYCPGGDLGEHLQKERRFTEDKARFYLAEITLALEDLHKRDIIFRDLKPDNIVLDANGHAMLTDFGLSKEGVLDQVNGARSFCGSVAYLAPEMLKRVGHGKAVDWYLLGVVFYEMLVGVPPYYANNREELFANIEKAPLKIPSKISAEAKSLLVGLLQRNPAKRLGAGKGDAEEIKAHPFFAKLSWEEVEKKKLKMPIPEKRINFAQQMSLNPFGGFPQESPDDNRIVGWSFVAPRQQEPNN